MTSPRPPRLARHVVRRRVAPDDRDDVLGDLGERFRRRARRDGLRAARRWYRRQALHFLLAGSRPPTSARPGLRGALARAGRAVDAQAADLRRAARTLRNEPLLSAAVVLTVGIGIGIPTAAFNLASALAFRPPVSADPDAFFRVVRADRAGAGIATPSQYLALRDGARSVREMAAWSFMALHAPLGLDDPVTVPALLVTCNLSRVLGVDAPTAGRLLEPGDCAAASPVAVVSERLWRSRFGGAPSVVGTSIRYGGVPVTIVGVAALPAIQVQADDPDLAADLWFPYTAHPALKEAAELGMFLREDFPWLAVAGLLAPGVTRQAATADLRLVEARRSPEPAPERAVVLTDGTRWAGVQPDDVVELFAMALVLPVLLLVVACINAAALLLSRAVGRHREMALRLALGTSRAALVRLLLAESLLLAGLAALASLVLVRGLPPLLVRHFEAEAWFGTAGSVRPDGRVLAFLAACGVLAAVLAGLAPALEALNPRLAESLQGRRSFLARRGTSRARRIFVMVQVVATMVLLVTAATFSRTATRFTVPGFRTEGLLVAELPDPGDGGAPLASLAGDVAAVPGVASVAWTRTLPLLREGAMRVGVPGRPPPAYSMAASVSGDYFEVFGLPMLAGRSFEEADARQAGALRPVVVSRRFARRFLGKDDVVGEVIETEGPAGEEHRVVVGVVTDRVTGLAGTSSALNDGSMVYEPMDPSATAGYLVVEAAGSAAALADGLRDRLRTLTGAAASVETFESRLAAQVLGVRRIQALVLALGAIALLMSIVGVVGTVSAEARRRTREFAIRLALGAGPWAVGRRVLLSGLVPVLAGVAVGMLAAWAAVRAAELQRLLPLGSVAGEPGPYVAVSALLLATALATLLAVALPVARRDPLESLREE